MTQTIVLRYEDLLHNRRYISQMMDREWTLHVLYHTMLNSNDTQVITCLVKEDANVTPWVYCGKKQASSDGRALVGVVVRGAPPPAEIAADLERFV